MRLDVIVGGAVVVSVGAALYGGLRKDPVTCDLCFGTVHCVQMHWSATHKGRVAGFAHHCSKTTEKSQEQISQERRLSCNDIPGLKV
eukprot:1151547-Pelagomonas_calceolata.AAC.1